MHISTILKPDLVTFLQNKEKEEVLKELVALVVKGQYIKDSKSLFEQLCARERIMSTGIGLGIGVPHVRFNEIKDPLIVIGVSKEAITHYDSLDNQPVQIIFMVLVAQGQHKEYIRILSGIAKVLKNEEFRKLVVQLPDAQNLYDELKRAFYAKENE